MKRISLALLTGALLMLGACGFQPLYATRDGNVSEALERVQVSAIEQPDPAGWLLQRDLTSRLDPNARAAAPTHTLDVTLSERRTRLGIQIDGSVTRFNYALTGNFRLMDAASGETVLSSRSVSIAAYNVVNSQFATLTAEKDARRKAAEQLSADIELQLALYFAKTE
ncbi:MAG: LPS assembly lipoprotein LptE [Pseudomonadota bacterium]